MTQQELVGLDTSFEKSVIDAGEGVRQRARAIHAFLGLAERLDFAVQPEVVEQLRGLSKSEAKMARISLEHLVTLFGDKPEAEAQEVAEVQVVDTEEHPLVDNSTEGDVPVEPTPAPTVAPVPRPIPRPPLPKGAVAEAPRDQANQLIVEQTEVATAKQEQTSKPLDASKKRWLTGLIDQDIDSLTEDDIPVIVKKLSVLYGPRRRTSTSIDYDQMLTQFLLGASYSEIAELVGSTEGSLKQTIPNYKKKILENRNKPVETPLVELPVSAQEVEPAVEPAVERTFEPTPKLVETNEDDEALNAKKELQAEHKRQLQVAVEHPERVGLDEWRDIAEGQIFELAEPLLTRVQTEALWSHLHLDDDGEYRKATADYQAALEQIRPRFRDLVNRRFIRGSAQADSLKTLFNNAMGFKNIDDIHAILSKRDTGVTRNITQRVVTLAMVELLEQDD